MSELLLRVDKYLDGAEVPHGAVAQVLAFDSRGGRSPAADVRDVVVPVGGNVAPASIPVEPGDYLIEVLLPNGERTSAEVRAGEAPVSVDLAVTHSPREWLSWQHLVGGVPLRENMRPGRGAGPVRLEWLEGLPRGRVGLAGPGYPWRAVLAIVTGAEPAPEGLAVAPLTGESGWQLYRFGAAGALKWLDQEPEPGGPMRRRYLVARSGADVSLVPVPVPWPITSGGAAVVDVLVRDQPDGARILISPMDQYIAPVIGFLSAGSAQPARVLVDHARSRLFEKMVNPFAAAAGGYVLLATEETGDTAWHPLIANLAARFDWLPDGAVLQGRLLLRHRSGSADVHAARDSFMEAYRRGLPFYTLGLQWLVDGLRTFAGTGDEEAGRMLATVQEVAWHADLAQPFATLRSGTG
ncbi:hypothetical protein [Occultella gossypii]|uniref:Uncharacterized protein n=1 Tax=Occultella gossypii TaxID=2800820 RepID=A0ABS7S447_9MICO|nr:hypothetical protein [Occultella gossypii]MBZ2194683.1 hypothetical protein [Occultella gossypii]